VADRADWEEYLEYFDDDSGRRPKFSRQQFDTLDEELLNLVTWDSIRDLTSQEELRYQELQYLLQAGGIRYGALKEAPQIYRQSKTILKVATCARGEPVSLEDSLPQPARKSEEEHRKPVAGDPFRKGDCVKVKSGVVCPDYEGLCIGGWQGRVTKFTEADDGTQWVDIAWDSIALEALPESYIKESEEEGLDWTEMVLNANEVEPADPRDSEQATEDARAELEGRYTWFGMGEEGKRILQVVGGIDPEDEMKLLNAWGAYLRGALRFPFSARVSEDQEETCLCQGDRVDVLGLSEMDDLRGILVDVRHGRKDLVFPLADLTVLKRKNANYQPVKDYAVWFANR
jgi:hypothetical protein